MPSIKGTASVTDNRALQKRLATVKFPLNFADKLDVEKVNRAVLTQWIEQKITQLLGFEDEIVSSTAVNLFLPVRVLDGPRVEVDPKKAQIDLEGFLGAESSAEFCAACWDLLLDAQSQPSGVPKNLVEEKKKELEAQKAQATRQRAPPPRGRGPVPHYYDRGPPPPPRQGGPPPPARRSVSPERMEGGRDEFGRSRPSPNDDRRGSHPTGREADRGRPSDNPARRYGRRQPSPPPYHRHRDQDRRRDDFRYRYHPDDEERGSRSRRPRSRSRSRSPPPRRPRRRSRSASSSSSDSSRSASSGRGNPRRRR